MEPRSATKGLGGGSIYDCCAGDLGFDSRIGPSVGMTCKYLFIYLFRCIICMY